MTLLVLDSFLTRLAIPAHIISVRSKLQQVNLQTKTKDLRVLPLVCLCLVGIKGATRESAVKESPEIQNTKAKKH